jgi:transcriptional regulator GlxA family with amidase domain
MPVQRVGILLLPGFALGTLAGVVDALAAAAAWQGEDEAVCEPLLLSLDGAAVRSGAGVWVAAGAVSAAPPLQMALLLADTPWQAGEALNEPARQWLLAMAATGVPLGGLGTGAAWLAEAGLLRGHRATLHWPHIAALAERHPEVVLSQQLCEIDRDRLSCASGDAARDLMIAWLGQRHGERLAQALAAHFGLERPRPRDERQRVPTVARLGSGSAKLSEALALMESNLSEPLSTEDVARLVGVSRRQLERLFRQHLDALPSRWYLSLRLARAQQLLRQTPQSVLQIGLACGFASGPHFSNAYRAHFGHTPRDERSPRAMAWQQAEPLAPAGALLSPAGGEPVR